MLALKKTHCWIQPLDTHTTPHIPPYRAIFILICCDHRFLHSDCNAIRFHLFMHIEWEHFFFFFYSWLHSLFRFGVKTFDVFYIHLCILLTICLRSAFISEIYFYSEFGFSHVVGVLLAMLMMIRFFFWFYLIVLLLLGLPFFSLFATMLVLFFWSKIYMQLSKTENECRHLKALPKNEPKSALDSVSHRFICCLLFYFILFLCICCVGHDNENDVDEEKNKQHAQNVCMCWHSEVSDEPNRFQNVLQFC